MFGYIRTRFQQHDLLEAIRKRNLKRIRRLVAEGLDLNFRRQGFSPLSRAVSGMKSPEDRAVVDLLISLGASLSGPGNEYLLVMAARQGDHELIDLSLAAGHNIHSRPKNSNSALQVAAHRNKPETMKYLIERGANKEDFELDYCRWYAVRNEVIRILLELGVDVPKDVRDFLLDERNNLYRRS